MEWNSRGLSHHPHTSGTTTRPGLFSRYLWRLSRKLRHEANYISKIFTRQTSRARCVSTDMANQMLTPVICNFVSQGKYFQSQRNKTTHWLTHISNHLDLNCKEKRVIETSELVWTCLGRVRGWSKRKNEWGGKRAGAWAGETRICFGNHELAACSSSIELSTVLYYNMILIFILSLFIFFFVWENMGIFSINCSGTSFASSVVLNPFTSTMYFSLDCVCIQNRELLWRQLSQLVFRYITNIEVEWGMAGERDEQSAVLAEKTSQDFGIRAGN